MPVTLAAITCWWLELDILSWGYGRTCKVVKAIAQQSCILSALFEEKTRVDQVRQIAIELKEIGRSGCQTTWPAHRFKARAREHLFPVLLVEKCRTTNVAAHGAT